MVRTKKLLIHSKGVMWRRSKDEILRQRAAVTFELFFAKSFFIRVCRRTPMASVMTSQR
jgi:hypothetical protein